MRSFEMHSLTMSEVGENLAQINFDENPKLERYERGCTLISVHPFPTGERLNPVSLKPVNSHAMLHMSPCSYAQQNAKLAFGCNVRSIVSSLERI